MNEKCCNSIKVKLSSPRQQQTRRGSRWRVTCCAAPSLLILPSGNKRAPVGETRSRRSSAASSAGQEKCREQKLVNIHIIFLDAFLHRGRLQVGRRRAFLAHRRAAFSGVTNSTIGCASWVPAGSALCCGAVPSSEDAPWAGGEKTARLDKHWGVREGRCARGDRTQCVPIYRQLTLYIHT